VSALFVRISPDPKRRLNSPGESGLAGGSSPIYWMGEFTYKKGTEIYGEKEPASYVYQVKAGAVRSYKLLSDGRRQIGAFHLKDDIFGFTDGDTHRFTAEAVVETTLWLLKRRSLQTEAQADCVLSRYLLSLTTRSLQHAEDHMLLLGRKDALEKVATFLIEMDQRLTAAGVMTLPMTRQDIADYLGLTLETVSRSLTRLGRAGIVNFAGETQREITILDRTQLLSLDLQ
jgi:CRP/FNR family nitrogen fixation transcriptional regulator